MNKTTQLLTLGAALLLAPLTSTLAQSWITVDELAPWRGRDIVADVNGNFISLALDNGATGGGGVVSTAVSVSTNHGATWQTVGSIAGYANDLAVAPDGALFATGNRSDTVSGGAFVWQSLDRGTTWTVSDPWAGQPTQFLSTDLAVGNSGSVYVCGFIYAGGRWVVRRGDRVAGAMTWTTVDDIPGNQADAICVRPASVSGQPDEVLASGRVSGLWTVRRSVNSGGTWATVDSYSTAASAVTGLTTGLGNSIYASGRIATTTYVTNQTVIKKKVVTTVTPTTVYGLLVRRSTNGGASWVNVDFATNMQPSACNCLAADAFGRVFAVGFSIDTPNIWLVRGSANGGSTWVPTDSFLPAGETRAQAMAVAIDAPGNVCVTGETGTTASTYAAPIRRLAAP